LLLPVPRASQNLIVFVNAIMTRPTGSETHFKVIVVSTKFNEARTPIAKHRLVNNVLKEEVAGPVHALSIVAMTPEKWQDHLQKGKSIGASPSCRGGDGSLPKKN
jgi:BolA protein